MFKVGEIVTRQSGIEKELHKIEMINGFDLKIFSQDMSHSYWAFRGLFRHATPEEISAGHRIDTNTGVRVITPSGASKVKGGLTAFIDMGDDSHIENHVSPNCKKFDERVE